ncbi:nuclear protein 2-like [Theropithecus gelada]|uniref:nuclear protein 2-like n=1 Tax=Theropithecus gelada TaxID=9565 RepID=UPI000DC15B2A|nr:nuclear protein 2-like [Theropithecus gelada]
MPLPEGDEGGVHQRGFSPPSLPCYSDPLQYPQAPTRPPPLISYKEELYHWLYYYYLRDFSACGVGRSKGLTLKEQALRTKRLSPGRHKHKVGQKLLSGHRKPASSGCSPCRTLASPEPGIPKDLFKVFSVTPTVTWF